MSKYLMTLFVAAFVFPSIDIVHAQQSFTIRNQKTGMLLTAHGGVLVQFPQQIGNRAQRWFLLRQQDGCDQIVNQANGVAMTVEKGDERYPVTLLPPGQGQRNQHWRFVPSGHGQHYYIVPDLHDRRAIDVPGGEALPGKMIQIYKRNGTDAQRFLVEP